MKELFKKMVEGRGAAGEKRRRKDPCYYEIRKRLWLLPYFLRPMPDAEIQLRWRPYQCYRRVSYDFTVEEDYNRGNTSNETDGDAVNKINNIKQSLLTLKSRIDGLEDAMKGELYMCSRALHMRDLEGSREEIILSTLRNKIALMMQSSIPTPRQREKESGTVHSFQDISIGSLKADADCSLRDFQLICRQIQLKIGNAVFLPSFSDIQEPSGNVDVLETQFSHLYDLCQIIGFSSNTDIRMLVRKWKGCSKGSASLDKVLRLIGSYVSDKQNPSGPSAIIVGYAPTQLSQKDVVTGLFRESRRFDG